MRNVADLAVHALGALTLAASALASAPQALAVPPPQFPNLDGFTAVPADGYVATLVAGEVTFEGGEPTGARPGQLVRFGAGR